MDYSDPNNCPNGPIDISLELISNERIATYNPTDNVEHTLTYEVTLQDLTIGTSDLVSTPITGNAKLVYRDQSGFRLDIKFQQDNVNLALHQEFDIDWAFDPVFGFDAFYSPDYFGNNLFDAKMRGEVNLESFRVPEPSYYSLFLLSIPLILIGQIKHSRRRKILLNLQ
jgi:hypothetical protein